MNARIILAAVALLAPPAVAAETVDEIVARHVAARGGREALAAVRAVRMTGRATAGPGRQAIVRREIARPGRIRTEFEFQGTTGVWAWDGSAGWRVSPLDGGLEPEALPAEEAASLAEQADLEGPLVDWKAKGHAVEVVGQETLPGGPAHRLKVTPKSGAPRTVWVDAATGLVVRTESTRTAARARRRPRDRLRRLPEDRRRRLRALHRDGRDGPAASAAHRRRERGGEPRPRRLPLPDATLNLEEAREAAFVRRWACFGLLLILVAAFRSEGHYRADEHFQTIEFASLKLGRTPVEALPWEYRARIRSWVQPGLYVVLARAADAVGVSDPFAQAFVFRLVSGLLMWVALVSLTGSLPMLLPGAGQRRWAVRLTWLAFWTPFLAVRTSSESLGASLTVLAVVALARAALGRGGMGHVLGAGLLFGLAFEARFAAAVVPAGLAAWGLATRRLRVRDVAVLAAAALAVVALSAPLDRWGYGAWTYPPLNYLDLNLWRDVAGQRFGSRPWYGYVAMGGASLLAPLLLLAFAGAATSWIRFPGHVLSATTAPFVLAHVALAHKEMRFLFPVAPFAPGKAATPRERSGPPSR